MNNPGPSQDSPRWSSTTKLVVGLTVVAIIGAMTIYFRSVIAPILLAFIIAFLFHPLVARLSAAFHIPWRSAVSVLYVLLVIALAALSTLVGYAIIQEAQNVVGTVQQFVADLPALIDQVSHQTYAIGPFVLDLSLFDLGALGQQLLGLVQSFLGQAGALISVVATSAASVAGWTFFILLVSYFLLAESGHLRASLITIEIPGYTMDMRRLTHDLGRVWDAFLRGQLLISFMVVITYSISLSILGLRYSLAIAIMAGLARFIPWVGPLITWVTTALVAFFQSSNHFGLAPLSYTILVIVVCIILDQVFDNLVTPRLMGQTLGVHPAAVLVAAIVAAQLMGLIGLVLAAPSLATINLLSRYIWRKMFDLDPWPEKTEPPRPPETIFIRTSRRLKAAWRFIRSKLYRA
jgi:predicted PurR-regulated permease PerM